jgi:DNA-binding XRE family transcriptional regulator
MQYRLTPEDRAMYKAIGQRIRAYRIQNQMTQRALGRKIGMSTPSITNIEVGRQHTSLHLLVSLAAALKCTPDDLLPDEFFEAD